MKKALMFLVSAILLIQFASAVADWSDFGLGSTSAQAQSSSYNSQFGVAPKITTSMANGLSTNNANIPYQPLVPTIDTNGNYLILQNGNYLQVYDKNLVLLTEKLTNKTEGQLSAVNYIGDFSNIENIVGFWKPNSTTLSFRVYNFTGNLSLILENNFTTNLPVSTNGVKCFTALGYGECYAFLDETINATTYQQSFLKIAYSGGNATFTRYIMLNDTNKLYEPPSFIDWDYDGTLEFLGFSMYRAIVIDYNGNIELNYNYGANVDNAKFLKSDAGNYKVLLTINQGGLCANPPYADYYNCIKYRAIKTDGTMLWETMFGSSGSGDIVRNGGVAFEDYNGDGYQDVFAVEYRTGSNLAVWFRIYKGSDGSTLYNQPWTSAYSGASTYPAYALTIARVTPDSTFDFVGARNGYAFLWNTANNTMMYSDNIGAISCIPADLNYDGLTEIVCTSSSGTTEYSTNYTNQNAYINSVTYSPSTAIAVNDTLTMTISATDPESDYIYYAVKCNDTASYTTDTGSNVKYCTYDTIGNYNATIRVRDEFHSSYDTYTQEIQVALTSYIQAEGGMAIPTELVSTTDYNQGLLPEIYYSMLAFFSRSLLPFIVVVVGIFIALIIFTIANIITKLMNKA